MSIRRYVALLALCSLGMLSGCGYIGFEGQDEQDAAALHGSGTDQDAESEPLDAADLTDTGPDPDAGMDAAASDLDGTALEAGADEAGFDGAVELDAAPEAGGPTDAALLDADALADADALVDTGAVDASEAGADAALPTATQVNDYCAQVPALPREPVIDGVVDAALHVVTLVPAGWVAIGNAPRPTDVTAEFALAFRPNGLYVYVRVRDPNRLPAAPTDAVWRGDSVELYADDNGSFAATPKYDNPGTIQIVVAAPSDATTAVMRSTRYRDTADIGAWSTTKYGAFPTADGYVVEAFLEASALDLASWSLSRGGKVGVDLGINVSGTEAQTQLDGGTMLDGRRLGQYFLRVVNGACGGLPFCTSAAFCTPTLID